MVAVCWGVTCGVRVLTDYRVGASGTYNGRHTKLCRLQAFGRV